MLLNTQGEILDELHYDESWHFELLQQKEGVSLERIDPTTTTQNSYNWHSAASTVGYATPGQKNSQTITTTAAHGNFEIRPNVFSPDLDGWEDQCRLLYANVGSGQVISVTIVDARGRFIKNLVPRALLSTMVTFYGMAPKKQVNPVKLVNIFLSLSNTILRDKLKLSDYP